MKVIFLDVDGVINTENQRNRLRILNKRDDWEYNNIFCKQSLKYLYEIIKETGSFIVLHTSRRFSDSLIIPLKYQFIEYGLYYSVIDTTPRLDVCDIHSINRELEIMEWLDNNPTDKCVILDDDASKFHQLSTHLVTINPIIGITQNDKEKVIELLNK